MAVYGGLLALATFDRSELKSRVFQNVQFKQFLEAEPVLKAVLVSFYNSKYTDCLSSLDTMKVWAIDHLPPGGIQT